MTSLIHKTATIDSTATVHPTALVGAHSRIGPGTVVDAYAIVGEHTALGSNNRVYSFAVIGGEPQIRPSEQNAAAAGRLHIGDRNIFREGVTISRGSNKGDGVTTIGDDCLVMAYAHVGHDCVLGDQVTLSNMVSLAGHVTVDDGATCSGYSAIHQFVRIGRLAFIAANAMVSQDVPPFCMAAGDRARLVGLNTTGLRRAGYDDASRSALRGAFKTLRKQAQRSDETRIQSQSKDDSAHLQEFWRFLASGTRGIMPASRSTRATHELD